MFLPFGKHKDTGTDLYFVSIEWEHHSVPNEKLDSLIWSSVIAYRDGEKFSHPLSPGRGGPPSPIPSRTSLLFQDWCVRNVRFKSTKNGTEGNGYCGQCQIRSMTGTFVPQNTMVTTM